MTHQADHQLSLPLSGEPSPRMRQMSRKANKRPPVLSIAPSLPFRDRYFLPLAGVPKTRADCPPTPPFCPHLRCRFNLALEDAEHRAGRPGLGSVARDSRGLTISQPGEAGTKRAGTTVSPRWMRIGHEPAEHERCCFAWIHYDDYGQATVYIDSETRWNNMGLSVGESLDVVNVIDPVRVTWAKAGANDTIVFTEMPNSYESMFVWIVRKRLVQSCALDVVARQGKCTNEETGQYIGRHRTLVARVVRAGVAKGRVEARRIGMDDKDFMRALMAGGEG